jgi:hypothetical protein
VHAEPEQTVPAALHARSLPMHLIDAGSQQSPAVPGQVLPAQQEAPVVPHATQVPPEQTSEAPVHALPAQQG